MKKTLSVLTATALALGTLSAFPVSASADIVVTNPTTPVATENTIITERTVATNPTTPAATENTIITERTVATEVTETSTLPSNTVPTTTNAVTEVTITTTIDYKRTLFMENEYQYMVLPDGTAKIRKYTGSDSEVVIPAELGGYTVSEIESYCFYDCDFLTSVTLPDSVEKIYASSFVNCTSLTEINADENSPYFASIDGILFDKEIKKLIIYPLGKKGDYVIPDTVTSIGYSAFANNSSLTSVTIPDSVTGIQSNAFENCTSLTSVTIPDSVVTIGDSAFSNCTSLISVIVGDGVTKIGSGVFRNCTSLNSLILGNSVQTIENSTFSNCKSLTEIDLPDSLTQIGANMFSNCYFTSVTIPKNVKTIQHSAFRNDMVAEINVDAENPYFASVDGVLFDKEIKKLIAYPNGRTGAYTVPDSVTEIAEYAFYDRERITAVTLPDGLTTIGDFAFYECASLVSINLPDSLETMGAIGGFPLLKSIELPENLTEITMNAFTDCTSLTEVSISKNVTDIGEDAFRNCTSLTAINVDAENPNYVSIDGVLFNKEVTELITFPDGKSGDYVIPDTVTKLSEYAFYNCSAITSLVIPDSVTDVSYYFISKCPMLTSITIGSGISKDEVYFEFGNYHLNTCPSLTEINVSEDNPNFASLDGIMFSKDFTEIVSYPAGRAGGYVIPDNITVIGRNAFADCTLLTDIKIGSDVTTIYTGAFAGCSSLNSVVVPENVMYIHGSSYEDSYDGPFGNCESLTSLTIMNPNTTIGECAFNHSDSLVLYGYENSTAEYYAKKSYNSAFTQYIQFIPIDKTQDKYGDIDRNGNVGMTDVVIVAKIVHSKASFAEELLTAADLNEDNIVNSIDLTLIKYKLLHPKILTEEEKLQFKELRQKGEQNFGEYQWQLKVLRGDISADSPRLTLDAAKEIIAANSSFGKILDKFSEVQEYPDFTGGSGYTLTEYWLDEKGNDKILITHQQFTITHLVYDDAGELAYGEVLFERN